ncbi:TVP38/TMEM64 family protein [Cytobacillus sp. IB215316]|uniref:TVP38/TMEM64 family protein n=1 Tax=Cytobacillus sp. IB215316 TaxID=3097354 RepID=UPI002A17256E|nr:VTT domain-containing protein [Cytobacillus sp. IB215316]MDX8359341.1 VTT domain-containing protein [Cytobacillus sp. IB215316]
MNEAMTMLFVITDSSGYMAPIIFIFFHLVRQFIFIPVPIVCIAGGVLFGSVLGTVYSIIGLSMAGIMFFILFQYIPKVFQKMLSLKKKWLGDHVNFTIAQISILRLIPFIHYHLLSLCIVEISKNFKDYLKFSVMANIPVALFYTVFGQFMKQFSPTLIITILLSLTLLFYLLREKQVIIKWGDFFSEK